MVASGAVSKFFDSRFKTYRIRWTKKLGAIRCTITGRDGVEVAYFSHGDWHWSGPASELGTAHLSDLTLAANAACPWPGELPGFEKSRLAASHSSEGVRDDRSPVAASTRAILEREARQIAGAPGEPSASDAQIRALRAEAAQAGDHAQALICDIATGDVDPDDGYEHLRIWSFLSRRDQRRVAEISTRGEARAVCASALSVGLG